MIIKLAAAGWDKLTHTEGARRLLSAIAIRPGMLGKAPSPVVSLAEKTRQVLGY